MIAIVHVHHAFSVATIVRETESADEAVHAGVPFPALSTLAAVLHQNQKNAPLLSLPARRLRQPAPPRWSAARSGDASREPRLRTDTSNLSTGKSRGCRQVARRSAIARIAVRLLVT